MNQKHKDLIRLLNKELANATKDHTFEWTSLQINVNSYSTPHTDSNNVGPSLIMLLGNFHGGAFHMADQSLVLHTAGTMMGIDGKQTHYSDPFNGKRVSVVAF